ncbi:hypothetical protein QT972_03730 [Microcoleus sp. herbarium7]|uniref:hypothetical protein n=1 Tax=unclassified Microcoleus TaxID=2642155 RepID=UPI002FD44800
MPVSGVAIGKLVGASGVKANICVGAKHSGSKSLAIANKLSVGMLRPYQMEMHPNSFVARTLFLRF